MTVTDILMIVPASAGLSALVWFIALSLVFYLARTPMHQAIVSLSRVGHAAMRIAAEAMRRSEQRLAERNREVLLADGQEAAERMIEREFVRIGNAVQRDLADYPSLQREMNETLNRMEEDYQASLSVPPELPHWTKAVEAVANIPSQGDSMVASVLKDIHVSMEKSQKRAIDAYRDANRERHVRLKRMLPLWRRIGETLDGAARVIERLTERSQNIDRHMQAYEEMVRKTDRAVRTLSSSSFVQFFTAALVLAIAVGGAMINFHLIARPMQEMVGGSSYIMGFKISNIAALVIILVEITMGLFLMEALRITRLFPVIGALDDKMRVNMARFSFALLLILASIEAGLAYMREVLSQDDAALVASLVGDQTAGTSNPHLWITTASQMGMGFILPFALTFVALPLESFIHSTRTVFGVFGVGVLRTLRLLFHVLGQAIRQSGKFLVQLYDVLIFGPLWLEKAILQRRDKKSRADGETRSDLVGV